MCTVSIVIPVYNRASLIGRCLDSVFAQTHRPLKVYVVDNASSDDTAEVAGRWIDTCNDPDFDIRLLRETRPGAAAARNCGLERVDTEYVIFFDSDDEMLPDLVEKAVAAAGKADIVYWKTKVISLDGRRKTMPQYTRGLLRRQIYNCALFTLNHMVRTDFVREAGAWNPEARVWDDWELGIRLLALNPECRAVKDSLVVKHNQKESLTGTAMSDKPGEWDKTIDIAEKYVAESSRHDKRLLIDRLDYVRAVLAARYRREGSAAAADSLLDKAVNREGRSSIAKWWLRMLHDYTSKGGRGAYYLWK